MEYNFNTSKVTSLSGVYTYQINNYNQLSTRVGDCVESPEFTLCNKQWQLRLFPGGSLPAHRNYLSFYLASKSSIRIRATYKLSIISQVPGVDDQSFPSSCVRTFEPRGVQIDGWGRDKFIRTTTLRDPAFGFILNSTAIFQVEITVHGQLSHDDNENIFGNSLKDFSILSLFKRSLLELFYDPEGLYDLTIIVGPDQISFNAHKCILMSRSDVFKAMFKPRRDGSMSEVTNSELRIADYEPIVVENMLHFMYSDSCELLSAVIEESAIRNTNVHSLLSLALLYDITALASRCEHFFEKRLTRDSAISMLQFANDHHAQQLRHYALRYIAQNSASFMLSTGSPCEELMQLDCSLLSDVDRAMKVTTKRRSCSSVVVSADSEASNKRSCQIM